MSSGLIMYVISIAHTCDIFSIWELSFLHSHVYTQQFSPCVCIYPSPHCYTSPQIRSFLYQFYGSSLRLLVCYVGLSMPCTFVSTLWTPVCARAMNFYPLLQGRPSSISAPCTVAPFVPVLGTLVRAFTTLPYPRPPLVLILLVREISNLESLLIRL
jgi:hypothetical protein